VPAQGVHVIEQDPASGPRRGESTYWEANARPEILERFIGSTAYPLDQLTEQSWRAALEEAADCLDGRRRHRGRGVQTVTLLASGDRIQAEISPHLTFEYQGTGQEWEAFFRDGRRCLEPLHDWTTKGAQLSVRF
jgi:hypothetical protein